MKENKIVTVTGHKNSKKEFVVADLVKDDERVQYVKPYTSRELPPNADEIYAEDYHYVLPTVMEDMVRDEDVLLDQTINNHRYVIFAFQMTAPVNVVFADDYGVIQIKDKWDNLFTVKVHNQKEIHSERVGEYLFDHEFDCVFYSDKDDVAVLKDMVV